VQIRSAVPEIFDLQTNKKVKKHKKLIIDSAKNRNLHSPLHAVTKSLAVSEVSADITLFENLVNLTLGCMTVDSL